MIQRILFWQHPLFVTAYGASLLAVVVLSLVPPPDIAGPDGSDKAAHLLAYGVIAFCAGMGFKTWASRSSAALAAFAIGIGLEYAQATWFARNGSFWDAVANGAGTALGLAAAALALSLLARAKTART